MLSKFNILILTLFLSPALQAKITTGLWSTGCIAGLNKEQIYRNNLEVVLTELFHQDAKCSDISFRFQTTGAVQYHHEYANFSEYVDFIDFTYKEIYLTIFKQNVIDDFNNRKVCGHNQWRISRSENITGLNCAIFNIHKETQIPKTGDFKYGIFKIENNKLYYGQLSRAHDGSTPEKRPLLLDKLTEYIFQN